MLVEEYSQCLKKGSHLMFVSNFGKCVCQVWLKFVRWFLRNLAKGILPRDAYA